MKENKQKVLFLLNTELFPAMQGGRIRSLNFAKALYEQFELSLLYEGVVPAKEIEEDYRKYFKFFECVPNKHRSDLIPKSRFDRVKDLINQHPWDVDFRFNPAYEEKFLTILKDEKFDYIFVRYLYQAYYVWKNRDVISVPLVFDLDDIESNKISKMYQVERYKNFYDYIRKQMNVLFIRNLYRKICRYAKVNTVCSMDDQKYVANKWSKNVKVIPNAMDVASFNLDQTKKVQNQILFCGTLYYEPNSDAIIWFTKSVFPLIKKMVPEVKLDIVGKNPLPEVLDLQKDSAVKVYGNVESVLPYYEKASLVVTPIRFGSGTRIKIIEAGACKIPVVSTTLGAEGLGVTDGEHCLIADGEQDFANKCVKVLKDKVLAKKLATNNYAFVKQNFDIAVIVEKIRKLFHV